MEKINYLKFVSLLNVILSSCNLESRKYDMLLEDSIIPIKLVSSLVVNECNDFRTVIEQDEASGLRQLSSLLMHSSREEAWMYLEDENLGVEVGSKSNFIMVDLDVEFIKRQMEHLDGIVIYHLHLPEIRYFRLFQDPKDVFPSSDDIGSAIIGSVVFHRINPKGFYKNKVFSIFGVTEYYLTNEGVEYFGSNLLDAGRYAKEIRKSVDDYSLSKDWTTRFRSNGKVTE